MKPAKLDYFQAATVEAAIEAVSQRSEHGRVIAGGQSLGPLLNLRLVRPSHLIDLSRVDELRALTMDEDALAIGACVTHARIEDGEIPDVTRGLMRHVAAGIAYRAVRNRGTIGGSLAHADPAADWLTAMIALDAKVRLQGQTGRRDIWVENFVAAPLETVIAAGEIISHVLVPRLSDAATWGHAKYSKKQGDFAETMTIAIADPARGFFRVVLGRKTELPAILPRVSDLIARASKGIASRELDDAIDADLEPLAIDRADRTMHHAIARRAVADMAT